MDQKRKWLEAYVMVISIIGVFSLFIGASVYLFNDPSQSIWELIGLFIVVIIVLAWFICLSILDSDLNEKELEKLHLRLVRCEDHIKESEVDDR